MSMKKVKLCNSIAVYQDNQYFCELNDNHRGYHWHSGNQITQGSLHWKYRKEEIMIHDLNLIYDSFQVFDSFCKNLGIEEENIKILNNLRNLMKRCFENQLTEKDCVLLQKLKELFQEHRQLDESCEGIYLITDAEGNFT